MTIEAQCYALVAIDSGDVWREIWRVSGRAAAIELAQDVLDLTRCRAIVVQGRGTPEHPTPVGEVQVYQGLASGYRLDAFFPTHCRDDIYVRPNLQPEWRPLLAAVPRDRAVHPREVAETAVWRRSYGQLCHALRRMRDDGLLHSPVRGRYQRVT